MSIKIVTDSTCDLPQSVVAEYGITVVPLYLNFGTKGYFIWMALSCRGSSFTGVCRRLTRHPRRLFPALRCSKAHICG